MRRFRRAIVVVCDGLGVGEAPDAAAFGDQGSDTLGHVLASRDVHIPHLTELGLGNLTPPTTARAIRARKGRGERWRRRARARTPPPATGR
jgi:phosphopentomutase